MSHGAKQVGFVTETDGKGNFTSCVKYCASYKYGDAAKPCVL
jgi:hypothetical protein